MVCVKVADDYFTQKSILFLWCKMAHELGGEPNAWLFFLANPNKCNHFIDLKALKDCGLCATPDFDESQIAADKYKAACEQTTEIIQSKFIVSKTTGDQASHLSCHRTLRTNFGIGGMDTRFRGSSSVHRCADLK